MDLKIQGIPIHFPYKPYGCQLSMLNRVVSALNNKQGCLLESPTGTGKTLALLCASLGWLEHQRNFGVKVEEPGMNSASYCRVDLAEPREVEHLKYCDLATAVQKSENDDDFGAFIEDKKHKIFATCTCGAIEAAANSDDLQTATEKAMCILSSRKHSCINPDVRKQSNSNDACQNLKGTCPFDLGRNKHNLGRHIKALNRKGPWDLEDYVEAMSKVPTCPYFLAFKILERASLCFCPYNYLLDPVFRETVDSEISNSIIIIDEAHNIEDAARSATSVTLLERDVTAASEDLKRYLVLLESDPSGSAAVSLTANDVRALIALLDAIYQVMMLTRSRLVTVGTYATSAQVWSGKEIEGLLSTVGLGVDQFESVRASFNRLNKTIQKEATINRDSTGRKEDSTSPSSLTVRLFTYIFTMLKFMYNDNMRRMQDYRAVLMEVIDFEKQILKDVLNNSNTHMNKWLSKGQGRNSRLVERKSLSLNFWCLSPAVCMRSLAENAYSLILASGTLAPLDALVAELQLPFPVRLEAGHVVPTQRVLAACVARGPKGTRLCATYANQNAFVFQDDVGCLLLEASKCVPGGVLCFFPSYGLMDKMIARWELTGMLAKLSKVKHVLQEPRTSDNFEEWVSDFQEAVDSTRGACEGEVTGALALAVCRGKISEGLDFADDYGRLVVVIGIPFPAYKDPQIEQKRAFNDGLRIAGPSSSQQSSSERLPTGKPMKRPGVEPSSDFQKPSKIMYVSGPPPNKAFPNKPNPPTPLRIALSQNINDKSHQKQIPKEVNTSPSSINHSKTNPIEMGTVDSSRVLSGSEWYEAQAYRALNQALGRCIRHRDDWGAIILAEARFVEQPRRYLPGISRWLRNQFVSHEQWSGLLMDLNDFVERMTRTSELSSSFV